MNIRKFRSDVFYFNVHLLWPVSPIQLRDYVRRALKKPYYEDPGAFTAICHSAPGDAVIGFKHWSGSDADLGTLVHEISHATFNMLDYCGIQLCEETDEVFAYLQNSLFDRSIALLPRKRRK